jgi:hypothetical protein
MVPSVQEYFASADAVFVGTVTGTIAPPRIPLRINRWLIGFIGSDWLQNHYLTPVVGTTHFYVESAWKGVNNTHLSLVPRTEGMACGTYNYRIGDRLLIYAFLDEAGDLQPGCTGVKSWSRAQPDLRYLTTLPQLPLKFSPPRNPVVEVAALGTALSLPILAWLLRKLDAQLKAGS